MYADRIESPYIITTDGSIISKEKNSEIVIEPLNAPSRVVPMEPINPRLDRILDYNEDCISNSISRLSIDETPKKQSYTN